MSEPLEKNTVSLSVKMAVAGITVDPGTNMPIVILKSEDGKVAIPIWIGLIEASAIATELEGVSLARPMTHDLLKNLLDAMGVKLERVEVTDLKDNTFYAMLFLRQGEATIQIDARPSDAIALALRTGAEIFVAGKVISNSQQVDVATLKQVLSESQDGKSQKDKWADILENLQPEDFGKYKM